MMPKAFFIEPQRLKMYFQVAVILILLTFLCSVDKTKQNQRKYGERELTSVP